MDKQKLSAVLSAMEKEGIPQIIISDPAVIFYLTGAWIHPGERLLALYLNRNGSHKLLVNDLFRQTRDLGVEIQYYNDTQDGVELLSRFGAEFLCFGAECGLFPAGRTIILCLRICAPSD